MAKSLPSDYVEVARWMLGQTPVRTAIAIAGLTLALFLAALFVAIVFVTMTTDMRTLDTNFPMMVIGLVLILAIHELTHAVAFRAFGVRPKFRIRRRAKIGTVFYVSAPGSYLCRDEYLAVGLAPLVLLTLILLAAAVLIAVGSAFTATVLSAVAWRRWTTCSSPTRCCPTPARPTSKTPATASSPTAGQRRSA